MPGWHKATASLRRQHQFETVGIIQEQHPDRCKLFMQWKKMDWPVMVDSFNLLGVKVVPITIALDEFGVVRLINPRADQIEKEFLSRTYTRPETPPPSVDQPSDWRARAERMNTWAAWMRYGDSLAAHGGVASEEKALAAYHRAVTVDPQQGAAQFRLGVAYRKRFDAKHRHSGDFQRAVTHWTNALRIDPNQYIWRRRIQQYGPRLDKPYPFYNWVETARRDILARGETPVELRVEPQGAELALPSRKFEPKTVTSEEPDPKGLIERDGMPIINAETAVVPATLKPGGVARVHVMLRPNPAAHGHWNNESGPLEFWIAAPHGWTTDRTYVTFDVPDVEESKEARTIEFEIRCPNDARPGTTTVSTYALYFVCVESDGTCLFRRKDVTVPIRVR